MKDSRSEARHGDRVRLAPHPLIYDWNHDASPEGPDKPLAMLDDETLRDGLQSPSVRSPTIDQKIDILHHMDRLGIDTADIGLPGAGAKVARDVERLARAIGEGRLRIRANCAARTMVADIRPIAEIQQRTGVPIECGAFIGSSPVRQYAEGWTLDFLQKCTEDALAFAAREGRRRDVRHRGHHPRRPRVAAPPLHYGDPRRRQAVVRRRHRRSRDAQRRARPRHVRAVDHRGARGRGRDRLARPPRSRLRGGVEHRRARGGARPGSTARRSASASAAATRQSTC